MPSNKEDWVALAGDIVEGATLGQGNQSNQEQAEGKISLPSQSYVSLLKIDHIFTAAKKIQTFFDRAIHTTCGTYSPSVSRNDWKNSIDHKVAWCILASSSTEEGPKSSED